MKIIIKYPCVCTDLLPVSWQVPCDLVQPCDHSPAKSQLASVTHYEWSGLTELPPFFDFLVLVNRSSDLSCMSRAWFPRNISTICIAFQVTQKKHAEIKMISIIGNILRRELIFMLSLAHPNN